VLAASGVVLRYGMFYGPGTYFERELPPAPRVHIDTAAPSNPRSPRRPSGHPDGRRMTNPLKPIDELGCALRA
jgi:hypothetical protein